MCYLCWRKKRYAYCYENNLKKYKDFIDIVKKTVGYKDAIVLYRQLRNTEVYTAVIERGDITDKEIELAPVYWLIKCTNNNDWNA